MEKDRDTVDILLEQLEKQHKLTSILTNGLVKVSLGILVMVGVISALTICSYFWSPDSYSCSIDNSNSTQTDSEFTIGGENIDN